MAHEWNAPPPRPQNWLMDGTKVPRTTVYCGAVQVAGDFGPGVAPRRRIPLGQKTVGSLSDSTAIIFVGGFH